MRPRGGQCRGVSFFHVPGWSGEGRRLPHLVRLAYTEAMKMRALALVVSAVFLVMACSRERLGAPPEGVHLRPGSSITYFIDGAASDAVELAVRESFQVWSDATKFKFSYGGKSPGRVARDGKNRVVLMPRWPKELSIGGAAWTQAYLDASGKIAEADILLNTQAFSFTTMREARIGDLYVEEVLVREIGRSLGIGLGETGKGLPHKAMAGERFEPGIDPAVMAAYLSLYEAGEVP